jgi:cytochrome c
MRLSGKKTMDKGVRRAGTRRPGSGGRSIFGSVSGLATLCLIAACGQSTSQDEPPSEPLLTAATIGEQELQSNQAWLTSAEYSGTDIARGERLAMQCRACHGLDAGTSHMLGPSLYGFFGQKAGSAEGFKYSAGLTDASFSWTPRALDAWLSQPAVFLPGNSMAFAGLRKADDRRAVIAYLLKVSDDSGS